MGIGPQLRALVMGMVFTAVAVAFAYVVPSAVRVAAGPEEQQFVNPYVENASQSPTPIELRDDTVFVDELPDPVHTSEPDQLGPAASDGGGEGRDPDDVRDDNAGGAIDHSGGRGDGNGDGGNEGPGDNDGGNEGPGDGGSGEDPGPGDGDGPEEEDKRGKRRNGSNGNQGGSGNGSSGGGSSGGGSSGGGSPGGGSSGGQGGKPGKP